MGVKSFSRSPSPMVPDCDFRMATEVRSKTVEPNSAVQLVYIAITWNIHVLGLPSFMIFCRILVDVFVLSTKSTDCEFYLFEERWISKSTKSEPRMDSQPTFSYFFASKV